MKKTKCRVLSLRAIERKLDELKFSVGYWMRIYDRDRIRKKPARRKPKRMKIPEGWRLLRLGQIIKRRDRFWWHGKWHQSLCWGDRIPETFHCGTAVFYIRKRKP